MKERAQKLKVIALLVVAAGLLGAFLLLLGNVSFARGYTISVDFDFSGNIQPGAPVKVSGIKVGKVQEVRFLGGEVDPEVETNKPVFVRLQVWLDERVRPRLHQDAEVFVNTAGVLGEQYLEIVPGSRDKPVLVADAVLRGVDPPRTDLIVARLYEFLDTITRLLHDDRELIREFLRSGASVVRTVDQLLLDNRDQLASLVGHLDRFAVETTRLVQSVHQGVGDARQLRSTLENVEKLSATLRRELDPVLAKAKRAFDGLGSLTQVLGTPEQEKLRRALDQLATISERVAGTSKQAEALVADLRAGKGTAGALLRDDQIYDDIKEMVRDLRRNPWKFLWRE